MHLVCDALVRLVCDVLVRLVCDVAFCAHLMHLVCDVLHRWCATFVKRRAIGRDVSQTSRYWPRR